MKINFVSSVNNGYSINSNNVKNEKEPNIQQKTSTNVFQKNSLSEAIGRSQVSFCGDNRIRGNVFQHTCSEVLGDKETISYNKEDGSFMHQITGRDGALKRQEEFFPQLGKEVITKLTNGIKTITTKTPSALQIEKFNEEGKQIYFETSDNNGNKKSVTTDYNKNVRITTRESYGQKDVEVIDLTTNQSVTTGDLVQRRYKDRETGELHTINVITGQILKTEKYSDNGKLQTVVEFSEQTGNPTRKIFYNDRKGVEQETLYDANGVRKSITIKSYNGREVEEYEFASDGNKVTSHIVSEFDKNGKLENETSYFPGTDLIKTYSEYNQDGCIIYQYKESPNVAKTAQRYVDGNLVEEIKFQKDGTTYEYSKEYKKDGSYEESFYNRRGYQTQSKEYNANGIMTSYTQYDSQTGAVLKIVDFDECTGEKTESLFDEESGYVKKVIISDSKGNLKEIIEFYQDSEAEKTKRIYNNDGSFTYIKYDEDGNTIKQEEYNADGTKKSAKGSSYTQRTQSSTQSNDSRTIEEVLDEVLYVISDKDSSFKDVKMSDWAIVAKELGFETPSDLFAMDNKAYRKLCKQYHPDLQSKENQAAATKRFVLVNNIYSRFNK